MLRVLVLLPLLLALLFTTRVIADTEHGVMSLPGHTPKYICPMHSHIVQDHEGTCPICGMDLVLMKQKTGESTGVTVSGEMQQAMALSTAPVQDGRLWRTISTLGSVQFDETGLSHLHPRATGWIETLTVNSIGQRVQKGELLYEIYSPDLLVAQEDFLSLLASGNATPRLLERGKRRLRLLGFADSLIEQLEKTREVYYRVPYYAQTSGIVSELAVREGMYAEPDNLIMTLADLSTVWVVADVFEHQMDWVQEGQYIEVDVPALQLDSLEGRIEFIYPTLDPVTRTLQLRLSLANPQEHIKPDMLAKVRIYAKPIDGLYIPSDALIQTEKNNLVFVQLDDAQFERREVKIGLISKGKAQILAGLELGERVVSAGQFLLDAEASLSNIATQPLADDGQDDAVHMHH